MLGVSLSIKYIYSFSIVKSNSSCLYLLINNNKAPMFGLLLNLLASSCLILSNKLGNFVLNNPLTFLCLYKHFAYKVRILEYY